MNRRNSIQKQMILDALGVLSHPTVSDVYEHIRNQYPNISIATIYRNLGYMSENGLVDKIPFPNEPDRFEIVKIYHHHAICTSCGKICDIKGLSPEILRAIDENICAEKGFTVTLKNINFEGICADCAGGRGVI